MVKRLRRCPLTAESAVRFRMGLPKKDANNRWRLFFAAPARNVRGNGVAVVRIRVSESCRGIPACGKRQIPQMITSKKHLKSTRTLVAVVRQFAARQILAEGFPLAGNGKFRK